MKKEHSCPLVAHVIYRLGVGGLENGLVNLINRTPADRYRHAVICLKDATEFASRIRSKDVTIHCLNRREGHDWGMFLKLYRLLIELKPDIVHTRNLAAVECQLPAWLSGARCRVHGEHGWDVFDPDGSNRKYQWLRKLYRPLIQRYIPLSGELERYLLDRVGVSPAKITRICNGVDSEVFHPAYAARSPIPGCPFIAHEGLCLIGSVGRMHGVKDQITLVRAFLFLLQFKPQLRERIRLVLVGDGPLREEASRLLASAGAGDLAWLPGERADVAEILRGLDVFVLPSLAEGISNTILEAMATRLPVVATRVGGNPDLVLDQVTGMLVPSQDAEVMGEALGLYAESAELRGRHGQSGLERVHEQFTLDAMVDRYLTVYDELMAQRRRLIACAAS